MDKPILAAALALFLTLGVFEFTDLDLDVQDRLFRFDTGKWAVDRHAKLPKLIFYTGVKKVLIVSGAAMILRLLLSLKFPSPGLRRRDLLLVLLSLAIVPAAVSGGKSLTNTYCPSQLARYGGEMPYVKVFEKYPDGFTPCKPGRCFPAGHASGGFALMALFFAFKRKSFRIAGLALGLSLGWAMGLYQMLKGAHFLSHTLVTMILSWLIILLLRKLTHRTTVSNDTAISR